MDDFRRLLLNEWFEARTKTETTLYHYTTAAGLVGIVKTGMLRGTSAALLNDTSEIAYGFNRIQAVLEEQVNVTDGATRAFVDYVRRYFAGDQNPYEVYVTSFSAHPDLLGQWRGYGSAAGRYSIGFSLSRFSERDLLRFPLMVEYDLETQARRVRRALELASLRVRDVDEDRADFFDRVSNLTLYLRRLACLFKHPGFAGEHEWRSVTTISDAHEIGAVEFEVSEGTPRPFISMLAGSRESGRLPIVEVRVGASTRPAQTAFATRLLLRRFGYDDVRVTESSIPLAP